MKLTKTLIKQVLKDFKYSFFISASLEKFNIPPYDFFKFIKDNDDLKDEYEEIENANSLYLENKVAQSAYTEAKPNNAVLLEMIKARNKKRYHVKEDEKEKYLSELTEEEIDEKIREFEEKMKK